MTLNAIAQGVKSRQTGGKYKNGADKLLKDGGRRFPDPTTELDDNVEINSDIAKRLTVSVSEGGVLVEGEISIAFDDSVSREYANAYIEQANENFLVQDAVGDDGIRYSSKIIFRGLFSGDAGFDGADIIAARGGEASAYRGGKYLFVLGGAPDGILDGQAAHEIGHVFGLGHQLNSTGSIMSYDMDQRRVVWRDIKRIAEAYK